MVGFQQKIFVELPVEILRSHYQDWNGRCTKKLYSMIGLMILQQMHDLTDDQAMEPIRIEYDRDSGSYSILIGSASQGTVHRRRR